MVIMNKKIKIVNDDLTDLFIIPPKEKTLKCIVMKCIE